MDWVMSCLFFSGIGGFECFCGLGDCECFWDCVVWGVSMDLNRQKVLKIVQVHTFYFFDFLCVRLVPSHDLKAHWSLYSAIFHGK